MKTTTIASAAMSLFLASGCGSMPDDNAAATGFEIFAPEGTSRHLTISYFDTDRIVPHGFSSGFSEVAPGYFQLTDAGGVKRLADWTVERGEKTEIRLGAFRVSAPLVDYQVPGSGYFIYVRGEDGFEDWFWTNVTYIMPAGRYSILDATRPTDEAPGISPLCRYAEIEILADETTRIGIGAIEPHATGILDVYESNGTTLVRREIPASAVTALPAGTYVLRLHQTNAIYASNVVVQAEQITSVF